MQNRSWVIILSLCFWLYPPSVGETSAKTVIKTEQIIPETNLETLIHKIEIEKDILLRNKEILEKQQDTIRNL